MKVALAFDVYGTLIDTMGVTNELESMVGDQATGFSTLWRVKQLEYTWRYGLMNVYRDFRICTRQALEYTCDQMELSLSQDQKLKLMQIYLELPPFADVVAGLEKLQALDLSMYAFSNGVPEDLNTLLINAGIAGFFDGVVSVNDVSTFKPNPETYFHFTERARVPMSQCWLISSNGFDVCGAKAAGMNAVWMQRNKAIKFDPWETQPDRICHNFEELAEIFQ